MRSNGLEAERRGDNKKAIEMLQLSLKHDPATDNEREVLQLLCKLYFKEKAFDHCLSTGRKLKETYKSNKNEKDEVIIELRGISQGSTMHGLMCNIISSQHYRGKSS